MKNPPLLGLNIVLSRMKQPMWDASKDQYDMYKDRELDMCLSLRQTMPKVIQDSTLFSSHTWERATAHLKHYARQS